MQQPHFASTFRITWGQAQRPPLCPPRMAPGPPRPPHPGGPCRGNQGGRGGAGTAQGAHPPSLLPPLQAGGGGEGGDGEGASRGRRKSSLEEGWGSAVRAARGLAAELGGEGFRNPVGAGPRVQMSSGEGRGGVLGRLGRGAAAATAQSPAAQAGVVLGPGRGEGVPTPRVTGAARVRAERRAE